MAPRISPNYNHISLYKNYEKLHIQYSLIYFFSAVPQSNNLSQPDDSNKYWSVHDICEAGTNVHQ